MINKKAQVWNETVEEPRFSSTTSPLNWFQSKRGQVWIETVIYTLIGLVIIGTVLAFALPAIQKQKDKATISNSVDSLNELDNNILDVTRSGVGNTRVMDFLIGRGSLSINPLSNQINFEIDDSSYEYSQPGYDVKLSGTNEKILTTKNGNKFKVLITLDYSNKVNITFNNQETNKTLTTVPTPYSIVVENNGKDLTNPNSLTNVNIYLN